MENNRYEWDSSALPVYHLSGSNPWHAADSAGKVNALPSDPCFILGNHRLTAFAHLSGQVEWISGERGWMRLNHEPVNGYCNRSVVTVRKEDQTFAIVLAGESPSDQSDAVFGVGYATYQKTEAGIRVTRHISAAPSTSVKEGIPCLRFRITVENTDTRPVQIAFSEELPVQGCMLSYQMDQFGEDPSVRYENTVFSDGQVASAQLHCRFLKTMKAAEYKKSRHPYDCFPPLVFLKAQKNIQVQAKNQSGKAILTASAETRLSPGERQEFVFLAGFSYAGEKGIATCIQAMNAPEDEAGAWKCVLPDFSREPNETLRWEMIWNAYVLECMATYHQYFDETFLPQGSVYAYRHGWNTSPRDHLQHLLPEIRLNPPLAKSCLLFVMKHMCQEGRIIRQDAGYACEDQDMYRESDSQLYLFMAVGEYLKETGDYDFLNEEIPFYPVECGMTQTVGDALFRAFVYLRDAVRCGQHGLIMTRISDWSDSFFHPYSSKLCGTLAESHMDTAMALAVLPGFIGEMEKANHPDWTEWLNEMRAWRDKLYRAFLADLGDRDYAPIGYIGSDGSGACLGEDRICLEAQIWILHIPDFPLERKKKLLAIIWDKLIAPEKLGARNCEKPFWSQFEGIGEDGGIWFALQGILLTALARLDREAGQELLARLTFRHFTACYPDYWVGQWTAPDTLVSTLSRHEGLYWSWTDYPFVPFCAHPHAWKLMAYLALTDPSDQETGDAVNCPRPEDRPA